VKSSTAIALGSVFFILPAATLAQECTPHKPPHEIVVTDQFALEVNSASGAVGDVVGVTVYLRSRIPMPSTRQLNLEIALCHDAAVATLEGEPDYTDELLSLVGVQLFFFPISESAGSPTIPQKGEGFILAFGFSDLYSSMLPIVDPLPLMTVYYRLKGSPGDVGSLTFCDRVLARGNELCIFNRIQEEKTKFPERVIIDYVATENRSGALTVLEGPATRPDRPPPAPPAKIYSQEPNVDEANFRIQVGSAQTFPGAKNVPIEVKVSAAVEYTSVSVPIDFDERYLRVSGFQKHLRDTLVLIDNRNDHSDRIMDTDEGYVVVAAVQKLGTRRLAAEGEEVHLATLYVDVLGLPSEKATTLSVVTVRGGRPYTAVRYAGGVDPETGLLALVAPAATEDGTLRIDDLFVALVGDADFDGGLDLTDAVYILSVLFLGQRSPLCVQAADFNGDQWIDLSDAVALLNYLFLGGAGPPQEAAVCSSGL